MACTKTDLYVSSAEPKACDHRARDAAAKEKAAAAEAKGMEEDMQASTSKLQKQVEKATAERNSAEGRSQRSAASLLKVKADLAAMEIKLQVRAAHETSTAQQHVQYSMCCC